MKSKSPSAAFKKSTPKAHPVGHSVSPHPRCRNKGDKAPWHLASLLSLAMLILASCNQAPSSSEFEETPPNLNNEANETQAVTRTTTIQTPTPAWKMVPTTLYRTGENKYLCVHTLDAPDGMVAQMLSSTSDQLSFRHDAVGEPVIDHYILGKTWNWDGNPEVTFIDSLDEIKDALADAQCVPFTTP
ncbi:hypothetical protein [Pelagicoccus sp. SDUM812002]|uniref:hypothetical protein n=1 Tax=Pelagicoccus sp. SDUM812002 TaxID=3041266 RepID=UPI00280E8EFF|nr:hypothetical protein [Pelagicoccus sp. SDUM812002]MDQ8185414.1 hypothetical protein [Pelagicoccus sp. SDUM812002]